MPPKSTPVPRDVTISSLESARRFLAGCSGTWVVLVFAEWCPHCVSFRPEWRKFAGSTRRRVAAIDTDIIRHVPELARLLPEYTSVPFLFKTTFRKGHVYGAPQIADAGARSADALTKIYG